MKIKKFRPPAHCAPLCAIAGTLACTMQCARQRDMEYFVPRGDITVNDLKQLPPLYELLMGQVTEKEAVVLNMFYNTIILQEQTGLVSMHPYDIKDPEDAFRALRAKDPQTYQDIVSQLLEMGVFDEQ